MEHQRYKFFFDPAVEVWMPIKGYFNYQISSFGRVKNMKRNKILQCSIQTTGYSQVCLLGTDGEQRMLLVHRLVADAFLENPLNKQCVDHIDSDHLNNHIENLRFATHRENAMNRCKRGASSSRFKGVNYHEPSKKWVVHITVTGRCLHLGVFDDEEEAGRKYDEEARKYFRDYAKLNFP